MYDDEMAWNEFRAKCNQEAQDRNDNIIKSWLHEIGYKGTVRYYFNFTYHIVEIYTRHPGQLIGKEGRNVDNLEKWHLIDMVENGRSNLQRCMVGL